MKKILIIEDEAIILLGLVNLLKHNGFEVISAKNGCEGIQLAIKQSPDLILCNIKIPYISGYQVFEELQRNSLTKKIPFIFLTAQKPEPEFLKNFPLMIDRYLTKPYHTEELLRVIKNILKG